MFRKIKSWMFASVAVILVEVGLILDHYHFNTITHVLDILFAITLAGMVIHYFLMRMGK